MVDEDFRRLNSTKLVVPAFRNHVTGLISIIDDVASEEDEQFLIRAVMATSPAMVCPLVSVATITILANDPGK